MQIYGSAIRRYRLDMGPLHGGDLLYQRLFFRGHREQFPEGALSLPFPLTACDLPKKLGGADARERSPGSGHRVQRLHDLINAQLQRPLLLPLYVQSVQSFRDRHDLLHMLGHSQAPGLAAC